MNKFIYYGFTVVLPTKIHQKSAFLANAIPVALGLTYLGAAGGRRSEFVQIGPQRIHREKIGPAGPHALKPLKELRLVLGEVQSLHGSLLSLGHDGYPDVGRLVAGAADLLHLCYSFQHGLETGLQSSLGIKYRLARLGIRDVEAKYHI